MYKSIHIISLFNSLLNCIQGKNAIVVNFGATLELNEADLVNAETAIEQSKIMITSLVVKETTALNALKLAKKHSRKSHLFFKFYFLLIKRVFLFFLQFNFSRNSLQLFSNAF